MKPDEAQARITDLEERISFQERTIQTLQSELFSQQKEIGELKVQMRSLISRIADVSEGLDQLSGDQPPPHY